MVIYQVDGIVEQVVALAYPSTASAKVLRGSAGSNVQDIIQQIRVLVGQVR